MNTTPCPACRGGCKCDTARICCCGPLVGVVAAGRAPPLWIYISSPRSAQQQTRRMLLLRSIDGTDRQADGRTPHSYIDSVDSVNNAVCRSDEFACRQHFLVHSMAVKRSIQATLCVGLCTPGRTRKLRYNIFQSQYYV